MGVNNHRRTVDFWSDPACPLSRLTARWIVMVAEQTSVDIRWRVMSLALLNEDKDVDPEGDEDDYLWIPARVAAAVQAVHGHAALGRFYDALWTDPDGTSREWIGDIANALARSAIPAELLDVGFVADFDPTLRASHHEGVALVRDGLGTPVLAVTEPDGARHAMFGPVIERLPHRGEVLRLWEGILLVTSVSGFRELQS